MTVVTFVNFNEKNCIGAFSLSDLCNFASILIFSQKIISTRGSVIWLKLKPFFLSIVYSYCSKGLDLRSLLDDVVSPCK